MSRVYPSTFRTYDEQAVIPLIIRFSDTKASKRIATQVRAIDIFPTLLDRLGLDNPYPVQGRSLMKLISSTLSGISQNSLRLVYSKFIGAHLSARHSLL